VLDFGCGSAGVVSGLSAEAQPAVLQLLLGYNDASKVNRNLTFRGKVVSSSSRVETS